MFDTLLHKWLKVPYELYTHTDRKARKPVASVLFLHGIGNSADAWNGVIAGLPNDIRAASIDLLGFGRSPRPSWATYDAKTQARSVYKTMRRLRLNRKVIIVGHSLGALVAVELATMYPSRVRALVLCSPPFYITKPGQRRLLPGNDDLLRKLYLAVKNNPQKFMKISQFAKKYHLVNRTFDITPENITSYMAALEAMIINQTSFDDALKLRIPITMIRGSLDPFVVGKNLRILATHNPNVSVQTITARHEIKGRYERATLAAIRELTAQSSSK